MPIQDWPYLCRLTAHLAELVVQPSIKACMAAIPCICYHVGCLRGSDSAVLGGEYWVNPHDEADAATLIGRIAKQDKQAFEAFYYAYAERLGHYLSRMLRRHDWVDEAVNDVMLAVWQYAGRFDSERAGVTTWVFAIAHNKGLKILERVTRHDEVSLDADPDEHRDEAVVAEVFNREGANSGPEIQLMDRQLGEALNWAISQLSLEHRCVLELCFKCDCSYQEIAEIVGCPVNTVKTRMFNARKRLAELLQQQGLDLPGQA